MGWPRKQYPICSCIYCHKEYEAATFRNKTLKWCTCTGALEERRKRKNYCCKRWRKLNPLEIDPITRLKKPYRRRHDKQVRKIVVESHGVYQIPKLYPCKVCGVPSPNRFYCPKHHSILTQIFDLEILIETGYSRRLGARSH